MAVDLDADAGDLGTTAGTGIGSANAAPGPMGTATVIGDGTRALRGGGAIGAGSAGSTITVPRPEVIVCCSATIMMAARIASPRNAPVEDLVAS
jgi:hypothetical protein